MSLEGQQTSLNMGRAGCHGRRIVYIGIGTLSTGRGRAQCRTVRVHITSEDNRPDPPLALVAKVRNERVQLVPAPAAGHDGARAQRERRDDGAGAKVARGREHEHGLAGRDADGVGGAHGGDEGGQLGHLVRRDGAAVERLLVQLVHVLGREAGVLGKAAVFPVLG